MGKDGFHERTRAAGANTILYWSFRIPLEVALRLYWRVSKRGGEYLPKQGPVIVASNHRSFFDPWVVGTMARRPMYYIAKRELFKYRFLAWVLNSLGAFPVERGRGDADAMRTAKELLERGEIVLVFVEGTRTRPGPLGKPKRGVARLALETGVPVVPVAIIGTERVRRKFWLAPNKVTTQAAPAIQFAQIDDPSRQEAADVLDQIWEQVELQWRSIGGEATPENALVHEPTRVA